MTTFRTRPRPLGRFGVTLLALAALGAVPHTVQAQSSYFGRNKVQYDDFDFKVLETPHFDIYYYPEETEAIEDLARMSERWYERFARTFQHEFEGRKPLIVYADHPDFQQTNTLQGSIGEGTGGVTESLKNRVILPLTGSYHDTDHVLGHELVHAFQYNIAQGRRGAGLQGLNSLPLWLIEGMAEYLSIGRDDPLTAMWMRDALLQEDFPTIKQMTKEQRFFPYRFGEALWAYIGGTYGDDAVVQIYRRALRIGFQPALQQVLGVSADTLSVQWKQGVSQAYQPLMEGRSHPDSVGTLILGPGTGAGEQNVAPSLSPDGRYVAFISEKDLFSVDLYLAETATGKILHKLSSSASDPHSDALSYIASSGTWSPDGTQFAYVVFASGANEIYIVDVESGDVRKRISFDEIGAVNNPSWSPDGTRLAFTGMKGGISDLYVYDLNSEELTQLTNDRNADYQPTWSPDGNTIAFASDRGPETNFRDLTYSRFRISLIDVRSHEVRTLNLLGNVRHSNPEFGEDGNTLFFLSDADGFADIYRVDLRTNDVRRLTRVATGVSGITAMSPAMSQANGTLAFSVFTALGFRIHTLPSSVAGEAVTTRMAGAGQPEAPGRMLPPPSPDRFSRVSEYLADASTGLVPPGTYTGDEAKDYDPSLALDYVGQPSVGVGTDRFGSYVGGGASAFFSDMLGNRLLGVALQAQGSVKDIGGQVVYADVGHRWNWSVNAGRIPYMLLYQGLYADSTNGAYLAQTRYRIFITSVGGTVAYPFSMTRRVETRLGFTRQSYDIEEDRYFLDGLGRIVSARRVQLDSLEPPPLNLGQASIALVGDNSFFGFTSPIRGGRWRFEGEATYGSVNFFTAIADWRRYWSPAKYLTVAARGLHYGRYGLAAGDANVVRPLFLGYETLIRGYSIESTDVSECRVGATSTDSCPTVSRLQGQRLGVVNLELRVPLLGTEQFGIFNFPYLPTELTAFVDGGAAWDPEHPISWEFRKTSSDRVPVFSYGVSARFNLLGFLVLEAYYANPLQRPDKGWHWGFSLSPGW